MFMMKLVAVLMTEQEESDVESNEIGLEEAIFAASAVVNPRASISELPTEEAHHQEVNSDEEEKSESDTMLDAEEMEIVARRKASLRSHRKNDDEPINKKMRKCKPKLKRKINESSPQAKNKNKKTSRPSASQRKK